MGNQGADPKTRMGSSGGSSDTPEQPVEKIEERQKSGRTLMIAGASSFTASILLTLGVAAINHGSEPDAVRRAAADILKKIDRQPGKRSRIACRPSPNPKKRRRILP